MLTSLSNYVRMRILSLSPKSRSLLSWKIMGCTENRTWIAQWLELPCKTWARVSWTTAQMKRKSQVASISTDFHPNITCCLLPRARIRITARAAEDGRSKGRPWQLTFTKTRTISWRRHLTAQRHWWIWWSMISAILALRSNSQFCLRWTSLIPSARCSSASRTKWKLSMRQRVLSTSWLSHLPATIKICWIKKGTSWWSTTPRSTSARSSRQKWRNSKREFKCWPFGSPVISSLSSCKINLKTEKMNSFWHTASLWSTSSGKTALTTSRT